MSAQRQGHIHKATWLLPAQPCLWSSNWHTDCLGGRDCLCSASIFSVVEIQLFTDSNTHAFPSLASVAREGKCDTSSVPPLSPLCSTCREVTFGRSPRFAQPIASSGTTPHFVFSRWPIVAVPAVSFPSQLQGLCASIYYSVKSIHVLHLISH